jgi:prepilin-type N-terminal cleavage/methylation domain-containing protein
MRKRGFTLVELLVVIAIIGLLSSVAVVALGGARVNARNAQRKANLTQITKALELYYSDNGVYPSTLSAWWGVCSSFASKADSGANGWIPNLAPTYIATLPRDPNTCAVNPSSALAACRTDPNINCYAYYSNGTDYKLLAHCTPEGTMSATDSFYESGRATWAWSRYTAGGCLVNVAPALG